MVAAVCDDDSREIFGIFPAHLTPETKAEGSAKVGGQGLTIHAISEQRLRMQSVCHVVGDPRHGRRSASADAARLWQGLTIHAISEQRLRMQSVCHIACFPPGAQHCPDV